MKNKIVCAALLSLLSIGGLASCGGPKGPVDETTKLTTKMKNKPTYLSSAVTSANLVSSFGGPVAMMNASRGIKRAAGAETPEIIAPEADPNIAKVESYIDLATTLLMDPVKIVEEASDKAEYASKVSYTRKNMEGASETYVIYLNETKDPAPVASITDKKDEEVKKDSEEEEKEEEEVEVNSTLKGLMIIDGKELALDGEKQVETEGTEQEIKITLRSFVDKKNYVKVTQESETEVEDGVTETELKYSYLVIADGKKVEQDVIKIEKEGEESEIKMTKQKGAVKSFMTVKEEKSANGNDLRIKLNDTGKVYDIKAFVTTDEAGVKKLAYKYTIKDEVASDKVGFPDVVEDNETEDPEDK